MENHPHVLVNRDKKDDGIDPQHRQENHVVHLHIRIPQDGCFPGGAVVSHEAYAEKPDHGEYAEQLVERGEEDSDDTRLFRPHQPDEDDADEEQEETNHHEDQMVIHQYPTEARINHF